MTTTLPALDGLGQALLSLPAGSCIYAANGDLLDSWDDAITPNFRTLNALLAAMTNGKLLIGHTANGYPSVGTLTAGANILITNGAGSITIALDLGAAQVGTTNLTQAARTQLAQSVTLLDLAGGAQSNIPIFAPDVACTLISAYFIYQTAAGTVSAAVSLGRSGAGGSATYFVNAQATTASAAQWSKDPLTLSATDVPADATVYCSTDGVGDAGKVLVCCTYMVN